MKIFFLSIYAFFIAIGSFFTSNAMCLQAAEINSDINYSEHVLIQFPENKSVSWTLDTRKIKENGRFFEIWSKNDQTEQRIVNVTSPFKAGEDRSINSAVNYFLSTSNEIEVHLQTESEALIGWENQNEIALIRLVVTSYALHIISYFNNGTSSVDKDSITGLLNLAQIVNSQNIAN